MKRLAAQRPEMPLILCEYEHAMGNSSGGLKEYWDIFYSGTNAQGAFVWDWVDQGIRLPVPGEYKSNTSASTFLAYGGWWEDKTGIRNDNDFNNNGLVAADRTPHPGLYALKYVYRNLHVSAVDLADGRIKVKNWFDFTNPEGPGAGHVGSEGRRAHRRQRQAARRSISRRAQEKEYHHPDAEDRRAAGRGVLAECQLRAEARDVVGADGARDRVGPVRAAGLQAEGGSQARDGGAGGEGWRRDATISGKGFSVRFDKKAGVITEYRYQGVTVLERGPVPDFWRAPTNNDRGAWKVFRASAATEQEPGHRTVARGGSALGREGSERGEGRRFHGAGRGAGRPCRW